VYGQELNAETYAVCRADMMLKGQNASNIRSATASARTPSRRSDTTTCSPIRRSGSSGRRSSDEIEDRARQARLRGRFGAGLPRINDGSFLFLQHMISKLKRPEEGGGRLAIVFNGSPLFTGAAGSGESEIRRWIIENDWLEGIVALPDQLFYNTGISTYFWIVTNRKRPSAAARSSSSTPASLFVKMRKSLGEKRKEISPEQIAEITRLYGDFEEGERVKILPNESFGYQRITVERPLRLRYEVTEETLPAIETSPGWTKLTEPERLGAWSAARGAQGLLARPTERRSLESSARCPKAIEKAVWDAISVRDPEAPVITDRRRAIPSPTRTCATTRTSRCRADEGSTMTRPSGSRPAVPIRRRCLHGGRGPAVRADAWVDHQDQDRLRDPAHPPVLPLRSAAAARRDRRRDQGARGGDPAAAWREVVSARAQQLVLIAERLQIEAATLLQQARAPLVALRRIVDLLPGFSYRSEDFLTDSGHARLLRGINVDVGTLRWDDTVWVKETVASTTSRFALAAGDIVMGMDRPVISSGVRIARVAEDDLPACLVQRVARLRARSGLSQEYLYAALRGPGLAGHFAPVFTGVSVPHVRAPPGPDHRRRDRPDRDPRSRRMKPVSSAASRTRSRPARRAGRIPGLQVGHEARVGGDFDRARGLDTAELFAFIAETQPKAWERLVAVHGGEGRAQQFGDRLAKQLDERGTVDVLRHGVNDHGIEVRLAFFKPAHGLTPELTERYLANRLTVTRQLPYEPAATKTLDLCLFVNGIPVATAELKNPLTHQTVEHAKHQYRTDRDPANVTLGRRALVHFAVDPSRSR
jgi:hypothetical protein